MRGLYFTFALLSLRAAAQDSTVPTGPSPIERIEAGYTDEARLAGLEGTVQIMGSIAEDGTPRGLQVAESLGLGLDEKALEALKQRRFLPGARRPLNAVAEFLLPDKQSRWHLTRAEFKPPEGASRPVFLSAKYPLGSGLTLGLEPSPIDEARILAAVGRQAWVILSFDVDENGLPSNFEATEVSADMWKNQAIALVREWRFTPSMKDGKPISVRCTLNLVWGKRSLSAVELAHARSTGERQEPHLPMSFFGFPPPAPGIARITLPASAQSASLIRSVAPEFPPAAWQTGLGGIVYFELLIGTDGHVQQAVAANQTSPFIPEAAQALMQWVYRPATLNGQPAEVITMVPIQVPLHKVPVQ